MIWKINAGLIWAAESVLQKNWGPIWSNFFSHVFFYVFIGNFFFLFEKYCSICTENLYRIKVKKVKKEFGCMYFLWRTGYFRAKNSNLSTRILWSVICWLLLWCRNFKHKYKIWMYERIWDQKCHCDEHERYPGEWIIL